MNAIVWVVTLILIGIALGVVEVLVIPGFGIAGILGLAAVVGAVVVAFTQLGPLAGAMALGGGLAAAAILIWVLPKTRAARRMVLEQQHTTRVHDGSLAALVSKQGRALTPLRPSGTVEVEGRPVDVVTDGEFIERGSGVRVARVEGTRVIVESISSEERES
jgi:membrane-bound serine protease (ClpP class)